MSFSLVYALHGFLGQASDWNEVRSLLSEKMEGRVSFNAENLFSKESPHILDLYQHSQLLYKKVKSITDQSGKKIFVGYSLGGRLGLYLLKIDPSFFDHYVFLSTNPGISEKLLVDRENRVKSDRAWSEKIKLESWHNLIDEWNDQAVFSGTGKKEPERSIEHYNIDLLKESMLKWSLGVQDDFSNLIGEFQHKITWCVGSKDTKYLEIAKDLRYKGKITKYDVIESGHRIWLDNPEAVARVIETAIDFAPHP